jgi:hypothetical protein
VAQNAYMLLHRDDFVEFLGEHLESYVFLVISIVIIVDGSRSWR